MKQIFNSEQFDKEKTENSLLLVYFSGINCGVCQTLKPKIETLVKENFPTVNLVEIPTNKAMELAAQFRMFSIPAVMLFVEGREYLREVRNINTSNLMNRMEKIVNLYRN